MPVPSDYDPTIPFATQDVLQSQAAMLDNFGALSAYLNVNHVDFSLADAGKHKWLSLPVQAAIPPTGSAFAATEVGLYNASNGLTSQSTLYINHRATDGNGAYTLKQTPSTAAYSTGNTLGWTYLPSGLVIAWGVDTLDGTGAATVTVNASGRPIARLLTPMVTPAGLTPTSLTISNFSALGPSFIVRGTAGTTFYWQCIGVGS